MRLSKLTWVAVLFLVPACNGGGERGVGFIRLSMGNSNMAFANAAFLRRPPTNCRTEQLGGCEVQECLSVPAQPVFASAGLLTVAGGRLDAGAPMTGADLKCFPNCNAYALSTFQSLPFWEGGETMTASAPGKDVPAFTATVKAPAEITVTAPTCGGTIGGCVLSRTKDLTIAWNSSAPTSVLASLHSNSLARAVTIDCRFSSSPGTIGAAAMAKLGAADAGFTNSLWVAGSNRTEFEAGDYDVTFEATNTEEISFLTLSN